MTIKEAALELGLQQDTFYAPGSIVQKFVRGTTGKRDRTFDMQEYLKLIDNRKELVEKTKLFLEYLVHEEYLAYTKIADMVGVKHQSLSSHQFSTDLSRKLVKYFLTYRPYMIQRFHTYFNYKQTKIKRPIKFKGEQNGYRW